MKLKKPVKLYIRQVRNELGKIDREKWAYLDELKKKAKAYIKKNRKANIGDLYAAFGKPAEAGRRFLEIEDLSACYHKARRHRAAVFFIVLLIVLAVAAAGYGCYRHIDKITDWCHIALTWLKDNIA